MSISKIISTIGKAGAKLHPKNMFPMSRPDAEFLLWMGVFGTVGLIGGCQACTSDNATSTQQTKQKQHEETKSEKENLKIDA